jgi:hypothetical protein
MPALLPSVETVPPLSLGDPADELLQPENSIASVALDVAQHTPVKNWRRETLSDIAPILCGRELAHGSAWARSRPRENRPVLKSEPECELPD